MRYGPWAIVTGCSSGIGEAFARHLASRGVSIVLVARRRDRLETLAAQLLAAHETQTRIVELDLVSPGAIHALTEATADIEVGLLVNNAGFGLKGSFLEISLDDQLRMLDLNCRVPVALTHHYAAHMVRRGRGGIIFVSSLAAYQGLPYSSLYAATKGLLLQLGDGLWYELQDAGVDVLSSCPGATDTEGPRRTGVDPSQVPFGMMDPMLVARSALHGLGRKQSVVPGIANKATQVLTKLMPRTATATVAGRIVRKVTGEG